MTVSASTLESQIGLVAVDGYLAADDGEEIRRQVGGLMSGGCRAVVVDLESVSMASCGGLREVVEAWEEAHRDGRRLIVCGASSSIERAWRLLRLPEELGPSPDRSTALGWLKRVPG